MTIPNWPPPNPALRYKVIDRGNGVIRTESVELLPEAPPMHEECALMHDCPALDDALHAVGLEYEGVWAACLEDYGDGWLLITSGIREIVLKWRLRYTLTERIFKPMEGADADHRPGGFRDWR